MSFRETGAKIKAAQAQIDALETHIEHLASPIERAAHAILGARRKYTRAGQYPSLTARNHYGEHLDVSDEGALFKVSNGRDRDDDFTVRLTWEDLAADPAAEAAAEDKRCREAEAKAAREQIAAGTRRLARARGA